MLEAAEEADRDLFEHFPGAHEGWNRIGMVHEGGEKTKLVAHCDRKAVERIRGLPENYDSEFSDRFVHGS